MSCNYAQFIDTWYEEQKNMLIKLICIHTNLMSWTDKWKINL